MEIVPFAALGVVLVLMLLGVFGKDTQKTLQDLLTGKRPPKP